MALPIKEADRTRMMVSYMRTRNKRKGGAPMERSIAISLAWMSTEWWENISKEKKHRSRELAVIMTTKISRVLERETCKG